MFSLTGRLFSKRSVFGSLLIINKLISLFFFFSSCSFVPPHNPSRCSYQSMGQTTCFGHVHAQTCAPLRRQGLLSTLLISRLTARPPPAHPHTFMCTRHCLAGLRISRRDPCALHATVHISLQRVLPQHGETFSQKCIGGGCSRREMKLQAFYF